MSIPLEEWEVWRDLGPESESLWNNEKIFFSENSWVENKGAWRKSSIKY
jgi:hypothetical protein